MREAIELHDSELLSIEQLGGNVQVRLRAYIHRLPDQPGGPGSGWRQDVALLFGNAVIEMNIADLPHGISDGAITGAVELPNIIPLPAEISDALQFEAIDLRANRLFITADSLRIERHCPPKFVEPTPASFYLNWPSS